MTPAQNRPAAGLGAVEGVGFFGWDEIGASGMRWWLIGIGFLLWSCGGGSADPSSGPDPDDRTAKQAEERGTGDDTDSRSGSESRSGAGGGRGDANLRSEPKPEPGHQGTPRPAGTGILIGRVLDPSAGPHGGATVTVFAERAAPGREGRSDHAPVGTTTTDEDGTYRLSGLPSGVPAIVAVTDSRFCADSLRIDTIRGEGTTTAGDVGLRAARSERLRVEDPNGRPLGGARVQILGPADRNALPIIVARHAWPVVATGEDGVVALPRLAAGSYRIHLTCDGYQALTLSAYALGADPASSPVVLQPGKTIHGEIVGDDGRPIAGARIDYRPRKGAACVVRTDERGRFRLADVAPEDYRLLISADGFVAREEARTTEGADPLRIRLSRGATVVGTVTNASGRPLRGAAARLVRAVPADRGAPSTVDIATAPAPDPERAKAGDFTIEAVEAGDWFLEVRAPGRVVHFAPLTVSAPRTLVTVRLAKDVGVTGYAVDRATGLPIANADVQILPEKDDTNAVAAGFAITRTKADANGRFELDGLPNTGAVLSVRAPGHRAFRRPLVARTAPPRDARFDYLTTVLCPLDVGGTVVGQLSDGGWRPRRGVRVAVEGAVEGNDVRRVCVTDAQGVYRVGGLPAGRYTVRECATGERPGPAPMEAEVRVGFVTRVDLSTASRSACVGLGELTRKEPAMITLRPLGDPPGGWRGPPWRTWTEANGIFRFLGVPAGRYEVLARGRAGYPLSRRTIDVRRSAPLRIDLARPRGTVEGLIEAGITGRPLAGASLRLIPADEVVPGPFPPVSPGVAPIQSVSGGAFSFVHVPAGTYSLFAWRPGYAVARMDGIVVHDDEPAGPFTLQLDGGARLEGTVRDGDSVDVGRCAALLRLLTADGRVIRGGGAVVMADDGRFRFPPLWPGDYILYVSSRGFRSRRIKLTLTHGVNPAMRIVLRRL